MKVDEAMTFDEYWADPRYFMKKPNLRSSKKQAFGDNIYSKDPKSGKWIQLNSHHTLEDGSPNPENIRTDTSANRVLISHNFIYWGGSGPKIPGRFDICAKRNHRSDFSEAFVDSFIKWALAFGERGYLAEPLDWIRSP